MASKQGFSIGSLYVSPSTQYWVGNGLLGLFAFFGWVASPVAFGAVLSQVHSVIPVGGGQSVTATSDVYWDHVHTVSPPQTLTISGYKVPYAGSDTTADWTQIQASSNTSLPTCVHGMPAFIAFYVFSFIALTLFAAAAAVRQFLPRFHSLAYKSQVVAVPTALVCQLIALPISGGCLHETGFVHGVTLTGVGYLVFAIITLGLIATPIAVLTWFMPQLQSHQAAASGEEAAAPTKQISVVAGSQPEPQPSAPQWSAPEGEASASAPHTVDLTPAQKV